MDLIFLVMDTLSSGSYFEPNDGVITSPSLGTYRLGV